MKGLYISAEYSSQTGGGLVSLYFKEAIMSLKDIEMKVYSFKLPTSNSQKLKLMIQGYLLGMSHGIIDDILSKIGEDEYDFIFINTSNFGLLTKKIKQQFPTIPIITLCHNVEVNYIKEAIKSEFKLYKLLTWLVTYYNERLSVKLSDLLITLNNRDSKQLHIIYHKYATHVIPICLNDRFDETRIHKNNLNKCGLFVGSNFFANLQGIKWFINNVAPFIDAEILIVGKGFELNRKELEVVPNIKVVGTVDSPDDYYYASDFVISPIFHGSGMKTKTAEAFMFGKSFYGTTEAYEGYDIDYEFSGALCNTAEEFIDAINSHVRSFNSYNRNKFLELYSFTALVNKIDKLLASL